MSSIFLWKIGFISQNTFTFYYLLIFSDLIIHRFYNLLIFSCSINVEVVCNWRNAHNFSTECNQFDHMNKNRAFIYLTTNNIFNMYINITSSASPYLQAQIQPQCFHIPRLQRDSESSAEAPIERAPRVGREGGASLRRSLGHRLNLHTLVANVGKSSHMLHPVLG